MLPGRALSVPERVYNIPAKLAFRSASAYIDWMLVNGMQGEKWQSFP